MRTNRLHGSFYTLWQLKPCYIISVNFPTAKLSFPSFLVYVETLAKKVKTGRGIDFYISLQVRLSEYVVECVKDLVV